MFQQIFAENVSANNREGGKTQITECCKTRQNNQSGWRGLIPNELTNLSPDWLQLLPQTNALRFELSQRISHSNPPLSKSRRWLFLQRENMVGTTDNKAWELLVGELQVKLGQRVNLGQFLDYPPAMSKARSTLNSSGTMTVVEIEPGIVFMKVSL